MKLLTIGQHFKLNDKNNICGYSLFSHLLEKQLIQTGKYQIHRIIFNQQTQDNNLKNTTNIHSDEIYEYLNKNNYSAFYGHYFDRSAECIIRDSINIKLPIVSFAHDLISSYFQLKNYILDSKHANFDSIIVPTKAGRDVILNYLSYIKKKYNKEFLGVVKVIPYGINSTNIFPIDKDDARDNLKLQRNKKYLLYIGRFSQRYKSDLIVLVMIFNHILKEDKFKNTCLILAGSFKDNSISLLHKIIKEFNIEQKVIVFPNFTEEIKNYILNSADIFVSLSDHPQETFGITIIEAMSVGLPLIVSDWNGYKELIDNNVTGYKVPTFLFKEMFDDPSLDCIGGYSKSILLDNRLIIEKIKLLLSNKKKRLTLGQNGISKMKEHFSWEKIIKRITDHIEDLNKIAQGPITYNEIDTPVYSEIFRHYPTSTLSSNAIASIHDEYNDSLFPPSLKNEITKIMNTNYRKFVTMKYSTAINSEQFRKVK